MRMQVTLTQQRQVIVGWRGVALAGSYEVQVSAVDASVWNFVGALSF
jgi:hypothetical protein